MTPARRTTVATSTAVALATAGTLLGAAAAPASAAVNCKSPVYKRQFFADTTFSGKPKKTDCDSTVNENWGTRAPAKGLPKNKFGVRWTVTRNFGSGGPFTLRATAQDGIRVYLDGKRKINLWKNVSKTRKQTVSITIPKGRHTLRIDYANWTGAANVSFAYTPRTHAAVDGTRPLAPTGASVTYDESTGEAKATWAKNKEMDLAGYRVYRRLKGTSTWKKLATVKSASYTDAKLPQSGDTYLYEVRAYDKAGNTSKGTADKPVTTVKDEVAPAAPTGVEDNWAIALATRARLDWDQNTEPDFFGYRVYRSTSKPVALTKANRVGAPRSSGHVEDLPQTGDWYYYVVTAVDKYGNESAPSGTAEFQTADKTAPVETALNARASEGEAGVTLSWDASGLTSGNDFVGYKIYRSLQPRASGASRHVVAEGVKGTSVTDPAPRPGTTYYYWAVASDAAGNLGTPSADVAVTVAGNTTAPAAVTGLTATPEENGVALSWDASDAPGLDHYLVYRGTAVDGTWIYKPLMIDSSRPWRLTATAHLDLTPADGEQIRYSVIAVDQYGNRLGADDGAAGTDITELDLSPTVAEAPGGPFRYLNAEVRGWVRWELSDDQNAEGSEVTAFNVYRWNGQTAAFELVGTDPRFRNLYSGSWLDRLLPTATTVYYRVTAVYADGTESGASQTVTATA